MNIYAKDNNIILEDVCDFDIEDILECGQCFHFTRLGEKEYELLAYNRYLRVFQRDNMVTLYDVSMEEYDEIWKMYFDMDTDYTAIKYGIISADERLITACEKKSGIRILKQDFFEILISFIISQNKQIPHIKQIVHTISERYGKAIRLKDGRTVYTFPDVGALLAVSVDELRACKVGFRAPYIRDAVCKVASGEITYERLKSLSSWEARKLLMTIKGVGEKVANCVLLFGLGMTDAFPVDVWMKRIMEELYFGEAQKKEDIEKFACEKYGKYAGYAQQYLFCYGREIGLGK
ncbi:MAG: DNA-3-methyladenine glycosylase family protein [Wujia sp.]